MSNNITISDLTGKGLVFPLEINAKGGVTAEGGIDLVKASIKNILAFLIGTRYFLGEFGSVIPRLLGDPNDDITRTLVVHQLNEQLPLWDKRFNLLDVSVTAPNESDIRINITIQINNTDIKETFIFPFYQDLIY